MPDSFIHLHTHSAYSLSEGAIKVEKLPGLAVAANMPAVALTAPKRRLEASGPKAEASTHNPAGSTIVWHHAHQRRSDRKILAGGGGQVMTDHAGGLWHPPDGLSR